VKQFPDAKAAVEFGERALVFDPDPKAARRELVAKGLTQHRNWWPDVYGEWCRVHHVEPDPEVMAYNARAPGAAPVPTEES